MWQCRREWRLDWPHRVGQRLTCTDLRRRHQHHQHHHHHHHHQQQQFGVVLQVEMLQQSTCVRRRCPRGRLLTCRGCSWRSDRRSSRTVRTPARRRDASRWRDKTTEDDFRVHAEPGTRSRLFSSKTVPGRQNKGDFRVYAGLDAIRLV